MDCSSVVDYNYLATGMHLNGCYHCGEVAVVKMLNYVHVCVRVSVWTIEHV